MGDDYFQYIKNVHKTLLRVRVRFTKITKIFHKKTHRYIVYDKLNYFPTSVRLHLSNFAKGFNVVFINRQSNLKERFIIICIHLATVQSGLIVL